ncbi:apolipoprotein M [Betta splendens]|uniref:Apolipoprotein M n=1 Tax=Betta splendens TaxID=158456 RepID=A0A6P7KR85_BETSP|nr:apolipoprotein M [Betta splendens]
MSQSFLIRCLLNIEQKVAVMLNELLSYSLYLYSFLYHLILPCSVPEQVPANSVDRQQYLGRWYFKAAVSQRQADIQNFRALDNILFIMEEIDDSTLLLTGHIRIGDNCLKQNWTYYLHPEKRDLELEGRPKWRSLLWNGQWANCANCIILQEIAPSSNSTVRGDSINRYMLYARKDDVDPEVVTTFVRNAACLKMTASVIPPQEREVCI